MLMDDSKEGTWIFKGAQVIYDTEKNTDLRETFSVANDLNWYEYNTYRNDPQEITTQNYKKGYLKGYFQNPSLKIPFEAKVEEENMILPPLLDFLSSVAAQENYTEGVLFALPKVLPDLKSKRILLQQYLWVKKGGDVPQDIVNTTPNGRSVQVEWLPDLHHQIVFYNAEHQLV